MSVQSGSAAELADAGGDWVDPAGLIGQRVGNYVIERALARGGMGAVYVARHPALGREVAVKFLDHELEASAELSQRFAEEARLTASLRHPNIVDIFDFGELGGRFYYVMELLRGRDLGAATRGKHFGPSEVLAFVQQICAALEVAHTAGVVHRDLKPANVFVLDCEPLAVKLMDFGLAKLLSSRDPSRTRRGQILGTPTHMAPEQALGRADRVTPRSDLYALGVIAYEMLAGQSLFSADSEIGLILMHVNAPVRPLAEVAPTVPAAVASLIEACLAKDPEARPASAKAVADAFAQAVGAFGLDDAPAAAGPADGTPELGFARTLALQTGIRPALPATEQELARTVLQPMPPTPAPAPAQEASATPAPVTDRKALGRLLERMQRRGDFPAFVKNVSDISRRADVHGDYSASQLSEALLRDFSLTAKLLRVVNLAYAARFGGRVHSVQAAVVLLGFERVRSIALSISLFKIPSKRDADMELLDSAVGALARGELARSLAARAGVEDAEKAQVAALFRDLGRHLVMHYLPDDHRAVMALVAREQLAPGAAAERVLGLSFAALGSAIAERWQLPAHVIDAITAPARGPTKVTNDRERIAALSSLADALVAAVSRADEGGLDADVARLLAEYDSLLRLHPREVPVLIRGARAALEERYASLLGQSGPASSFFRGASRLEEHEAYAEPVAQAVLVEVPTTETPAAVPSPLASGAGPGRVVRPLALGAPGAQPKTGGSDLARQLAEVAASELEGDALLSAVLEAYVGLLGFRQAFALVSGPDRSRLKVAMARGEDAEFLESELEVTLGSARSADPFTVAWRSGREQVVDDTHDPKATARIPRWYYEAIGSPVLVLHPCRGPRGTEVLIVTVGDDPEALPDPAELAELARLRAALAVRRTAR
ncbi:MAG: HDOD domain-containing protein [Myxococcales bacterium]|nr:HDOD domain-containing protein [Myxococcales bacterium]